MLEPMSRMPVFKRTMANRLRADETSAEKALWRALRRIPLLGTHFRRQVPIGPYVVDLACMSARLVIEVDGPSHSLDDQITKDARRTAFLEVEGYRVLRFANHEVYGSVDVVLDTIYAALAEAGVVEPVVSSPHPGGLAADPPPRGEGEEGGNPWP
jgi:very-short-patch-repair endonuclease